jgi:hypothetical protein
LLPVMEQKKINPEIFPPTKEISDDTFGKSFAVVSRGSSYDACENEASMLVPLTKKFGKSLLHAFKGRKFDYTCD